MIETLRDFLTHPLARGLDLDAPETTETRIQIIQEKPFLKKIYDEWYSSLIKKLPDDVPGKALEIGSGAGFLKQYYPEAITTDIISVSHLDAILDAHHLPFPDGSLKAIMMVNVFHHLPDVEIFFKEASRCIKKDGVILLLEPWVTQWSRFVYTKLHHEPFFPESTDWSFPSEGPLSGANGALPWIIFERDKVMFEKAFPEWDIQEIKLLMPFRYFVSGGVSMRNLMPGWAFPLWQGLEWCLTPWMSKLAMFGLVVLKRK